jgi:predicted  nucleic acid-binding Zn-ribbon protein
VNETVTEEIRELLASTRPTLDEVDATLTAGYAQALQLEAERWRLERRLGEVAAELADPAKVERTEELTALSKRLTSANEDISSLRSLLASLRDKRSELRIAS